MFEYLDLERPLILFDLETTDPNAEASPETSRIVQIGMRVYKTDKTTYDFWSLVNPRIPISEESSKIHGITDEIIRSGCAKCKKPAEDHPLSYRVGSVERVCQEFKPIPTFADIAPSLYEKGFKISDLAGYNHKVYDMRVLAAEFDRCGIEWDFSEAAILDGVRLWQVLEPRTLKDGVKRWADQELEGAHDAMADVLGTEALLMGQLKTGKFSRDIKKIHDELYPRKANMVDQARKFVLVNGKVCFNFGKNKGQPLLEHRSYVEWMLGGNFPPETKKIARKVLDGTY